MTYSKYSARLIHNHLIVPELVIFVISFVMLYNDLSDVLYGIEAGSHFNIFGPSKRAAACTVAALQLAR